jgi:hypothetical protein
MSRRADLAIAMTVWLLGLGWLARTGSWAPLAIASIAAAARLLAVDDETRRLLAPSRSAPRAGS